GGGRCVVAGHDDHLHVVAVDEECGDLASEVANFLERARAIRVAAGVAEVHEVLVGKEIDQGPGDGQPAEPAVEHPDGSVVHLRSRRSTSDARRLRRWGRSTRRWTGTSTRRRRTTSPPHPRRSVRLPWPRPPWLPPTRSPPTDRPPR